MRTDEDKFFNSIHPCISVSIRGKNSYPRSSAFIRGSFYAVVMSQFNAPSYEIPRTSGVCAATGKALEPGEAYYAALVEISDAERAAAQEKGEAVNPLGVKRVDYSAEAWESGDRAGDLPGASVYCFWKSIVPRPSEKKKLFVDDAVLMNLLERLADAEDDDKLAFRYVIALILMRKKLLRYDGAQKRDGKEVWKLTPKLDLSKGPLGKWHPEVTHEVVDPKLDESRIEQVTSQLGQVLETDL